MSRRCCAGYCWMVQNRIAVASVSLSVHSTYKNIRRLNRIFMSFNRFGRVIILYDKEERTKSQITNHKSQSHEERDDETFDLL
jgi:hypothetical protein